MPVHWLRPSPTSDPAAAPVASAGVSSPPTAPARRKHAVSSGFNSRMAAAEPSVSPLFVLTSRMLRPLPGSSGSQIEQMPVSSPAAAMAGINVADCGSTLGLAADNIRSKARPTTTDSGASANARNPNR